MNELSDYISTDINQIMEYKHEHYSIK